MTDIVARHDIPVFPLVPRRRISGVGFGQLSSRRPGIGFDDRGPRPAMPSDDMRRLDHKTTARQSAAKGYFEPWLREKHAEVSVRVMLVVDRSPRMEQYPSDFPWLKKPEALVTAGQMIVSSAKRVGAMVGYLDFADWAKDQKPFWRPANRETEALKIMYKYLPHEHFTAPESTLSHALEFLLSIPHTLPQDSFVFLLSDFLAMPPEALLEMVTERWDVTPVIMQDPIWEASFPVWEDGVIPDLSFLPFDSSFGDIPMTARGAKKMREQNEARFIATCKIFERLGAFPVVVKENSTDAILRAFLAHVEKRTAARR